MAKNSIRPNLPFFTTLKLCVFSLCKRLYIRRDGTINRRLLSLFDLKNAAPATKRIGGVSVSTSDFTVDPTRNLWFRLFVPSASNNDHSSNKLPLIVYFHGGGFNTFGADSKPYDDLCCHISAKARAVVASVNYRLAPEHRYPCQYDDSWDALKFLDQNSSSVLPDETEISHCFIAGDSAGGNIAHHVTLKSSKFELENMRIIGLVALQPFFGGEERTGSELRLDKAPILDVKQTDWMWRIFLPENSDRNHPAANVFNDEAEQELKEMKFPASLVIVGGNDPLQDWQRRYVEMLKNCGKEVELIEFPHSFHSFYAFPELPEFGSFLSRLSDFIHTQSPSIQL